MPSLTRLRVALMVTVLAGSAARLVAQAPAIGAGRIESLVQALAHDSMRGRATPSRELEQAAAYVAAAFGAAGLRPVGDGAAFVHRFPVRGDTTAPLVIGALAGADPRLAREYVAVVAHLDHVGVRSGPGPDSIFNGADDNASGTAGVVVLAEAFAAGARVRRSLLFLVTSGEERGLLGARWFVAHPAVALDDIVALVNLDMIGRNRPDSVYLNGWGKSEVAAEVQRQAAAHPGLGLGVGPDVEDRPLTPADSDHWPFQRRGIPYAFLYSGQHPDYHRASDEPSRLDADKAARVVRLVYHSMEAIANADRRPRWDDEARRRNVPDRP